MDYLARESADLSVELWNRIDDAVIGTCLLYTSDAADD